MSRISSDGPIERFARRFARQNKDSRRRQEQEARVNSVLKESRSTRFLWAGCILILLAWAAYFTRFMPSLLPTWLPLEWIPLDQNAMAAWGQFGDFLGGVLNPMLSFLALLAVVKNLRLQAVQLAQAHEDRFASDIANRMSALGSASDVLTASIKQDLDVQSKNGPVDPERYQTKLNRRNEITEELLRLAQQLLDDK